MMLCEWTGTKDRGGTFIDWEQMERWRGLMNYCFIIIIMSTIIIAGSRRACNLFCTPYLDFGAKLLCQNRSINPRKLIRIHFHSKKNILRDGRRVGQCTRFWKPKFRIIGVLTYISKIEMEWNSFLKNTQFSVSILNVYEDTRTNVCSPK